MKNSAKNLSIIDKELQVEGTISSKGTLVIKGTVKGSIIGETLVISEEGFVSADIKVSHMTIGGSFEGDVKASEELIVLSTGRCSGNVVCKNIVVESGGFLDAGVTCLLPDDSEVAKKPKPAEKVNVGEINTEEPNTEKINTT